MSRFGVCASLSFTRVLEKEPRYLQEPVEGPDGVEATALRMVVYDWPSAEVATEVTAILLSEVVVSGALHSGVLWGLEALRGFQTNWAP